MEKIVMITLDKFPNGDAGSIRLKSFCKIILEKFNVPFVIGRHHYFSCGEYDGIEFVSIYDNNKIKRLLKYIFHWKFVKNELKKIKNIKYIMIVDAPIGTWIYIKRYCQKNNIPLIHDCVEWYSKEQFKNPYLNYFYLKKNLINRFIIDKNINVISISNYLYRYFSNKGIHSIRIPVILDKNEFGKKSNHSKIILTYAGSPGKKDNLDIILKSLSLIEGEILNRIEIRLYGITKKDIVKLILNDEMLKVEKVLKCFGRVTREEVLKGLLESTYTLLYRQSELRYAQAGFPTKVIESMMSSVPVITNYSSDLMEYLFDSKNAVICFENSISCYSETIKRAIKLVDDEKYELISKKAYLTAVEYFDYRDYNEKFYKFLKESV